MSATAAASTADGHASTVTTNGSASLLSAGSCSTASMLIAWPLHCARDGRDDAGAVAHDEAQVVRRDELAGHRIGARAPHSRDAAAVDPVTRAPRTGAAARCRAMAATSETTATDVGPPPAPEPEKIVSPP